MRSVLVYLTLLLLSACHHFDSGGHNFTLQTEDLQVYPLNDHLWVHRSWARVEGERYPANGLIILDDDQLILVDTAWGNALTSELLSWIEDYFGRKPDMAILTHAHADRIGGLPALAEQHIAAYVHPMTRTLAAAKFPREQLPKAIDELEQDTSAQLGSLEVFYPGPAHSPDNIVVWYDDMKLLFGGCAVKSSSAVDIHYVEGSSPAGWGAAISRIQTRYPSAEIVVPGHGPVGEDPLLNHTLELAQQGYRP